MSSENSGIEVKHNKSIWQKEVKVNLKSLLVNFLKAGTNIAFLQWDDLAENGAELLDSLGLETTTGEIAGLLIIRALKDAIQNLIKSNLDLFPEDYESKTLTDKLTNSLKDNPFTINQEFFSHPQNLSFLQDAKPGFHDWLNTFIDNPQEAESLSNRLPEYFGNALFNEWKRNKSQYQVILDELDNPFAEAQEKQRQWYYYRAFLQKQVQEPVFWEAFSLKQIYIPLRAYYEKNPQQDESEYNESEYNENVSGKRRNLANSKSERIVVDLMTELNNWLTKRDKDDTIRLLTGAPGSGKSSFGKMWAAQLAEKDNKVLFIPLHRYRLRLEGGVEALIQEFSQYQEFSENPLKDKDDNSSLLIIFDGLDELSQSGKIAEQIAKDFLDEVWLLLQNVNSSKTRLQVLISGREVVIQANRNRFKQPQQLFYLLPYFIPEKDRDKDRNNYKYIDDNNLLKEDQRQRWWQKYAQAKGKDYQGLPSVLNRDNLIDITSQPLLNYLLVLTYENPKQEIEFNDDTNLNQIYADLLSQVYDRGYEGRNRQHRAIEGITKPQFIKILQEIAISCWHGNGRTTTVKEINQRCQNSSLKRLLEDLQRSFQGSQEEKSQGSITNLLLAFYFRESSDLREGEKTFEFSHKSFGEYLTAMRIVEGLKLINRKLKESETEYTDDYNERDALITWAKLCGASALDFDIFAFICRQIQLANADEVSQWQKRLCKLIEYVMVNGMPIEALNLPTFKQMMHYSKNSETALLAVLNACARVTKEVSKIDWKSSTNFGEWISRLIGQRQDFEPVFVTECLIYLDLKGCDLRWRDFYRANLERANLEEANLQGANLWRAKLERAILEGVILWRAKLEGANLQGANLWRAKLEEANLWRANLERAKLERAKLEGANLERAKLEGAILQRANLQGANLWRANLEEANLERANLEEANLEEANLERANLERANLKGTIYEGKDIKEITGRM